MTCRYDRFALQLFSFDSLQNKIKQTLERFAGLSILAAALFQHFSIKRAFASVRLAADATIL